MKLTWRLTVRSSMRRSRTMVQEHRYSPWYFKLFGVPTDIPPLDAPTLRLIDRVKALKK